MQAHPEAYMSPRFEDAVVIEAPGWAVWESLTRIDCMREWMGEPGMAIQVETDWRVGSRVLVRGFHDGRFENTGVVLAFEPQKRLAYTHLSSLSRLPDQPESYTTMEFMLDSIDQQTMLTLVMSHFPTPTIFKHLEFYWGGTLRVLKRYAELYQRDKRAPT